MRSTCVFPGESLGGEPWIGDIDLLAVKKIPSSSFLFEILGQLSLRLRRRRRSVIAVSLKMIAWPGRWNLGRMPVYGGAFLKMSGARSSGAQRATALG